MNVRTGQLRALVAVADEGTFTDAAIALRISQAAVSRAIAGLEAELDELERTVAGSGGELRIGYAWSTLGRHTLAVQRRWAQTHPHQPLTFVQSNTPTAGLADGTAELAVVRRARPAQRYDAVQVGAERRYAAVAADDPWARRRFVRLADFAGRTIAVDARTGTTTVDIWAAGSGPGAVRETHSVDDWLTAIAAGQAIGMTSEATVAQYPRPGVVYRLVRDAPPVAVWLAWWRDDPPAARTALARLIREVYRTAQVRLSLP